MTDCTPEFSSSERKNLYVLIRQREPDTDLTKLKARIRKMSMKDVTKHLNVDDLKLDSDDDDDKKKLEKKDPEPTPTPPRSPTPPPCSLTIAPLGYCRMVRDSGAELSSWVREFGGS
jgi:hypothetical protein